MPAVQMLDPVNVQKLIVLSALAEHKPTPVCRNSVVQKQQWVHTDMLFAKGTCQSLVNMFRKEIFLISQNTQTFTIGS